MVKESNHPHPPTNNTHCCGHEHIPVLLGGTLVTLVSVWPWSHETTHFSFFFFFFYLFPFAFSLGEGGWSTSSRCNW